MKRHQLPNDLRSRVERARTRKNMNPNTRQELSVTLEELEELLASQDERNSLQAYQEEEDFRA